MGVSEEDIFSWTVEKRWVVKGKTGKGGKPLIRTLMGNLVF